jgi:hypothetical protein
VAVNFLVDAFDESVLLSGVGQSKVVGSTLAVKEILDKVVGEV